MKFHESTASVWLSPNRNPQSVIVFSGARSATRSAGDQHALRHTIDPKKTAAAIIGLDRFLFIHDFHASHITDTTPLLTVRFGRNRRQSRNRRLPSATPCIACSAACRRTRRRCRANCFAASSRRRGAGAVSFRAAGLQRILRRGAAAGAPAHWVEQMGKACPRPF